MGDKGGKKGKEKNKQQQLTKQKTETQSSLSADSPSTPRTWSGILARRWSPLVAEVRAHSCC